jgi:ABC-type multidrug transport system ATPase subunit
VLSILGPNKAGKSTIAQMLSTMISPESGSIEIGGHDLRQLKLSEKGQIFGLVPHFDYLQDEVSVIEHLKTFGFFRGF